MRYEIIIRRQGKSKTYASCGVTALGKKLHILDEDNEALCFVTAHILRSRKWVDELDVCANCLKKAHADPRFIVREMEAPEELEDFGGFDESEIPF